MKLEPVIMVKKMRNNRNKACGASKDAADGDQVSKAEAATAPYFAQRDMDDIMDEFVGSVSHVMGKHVKAVEKREAADLEALDYRDIYMQAAKHMRVLSMELDRITHAEEFEMVRVQEVAET